MILVRLKHCRARATFWISFFGDVDCSGFLLLFLSGVVGDSVVRFNMVNLTKPDSLFAMGMRPVLYSHQDAATQGMGWRRCGHEINYKRWRSLAA